MHGISITSSINTKVLAALHLALDCCPHKLDNGANVLAADATITDALWVGCKSWGCAFKREVPTK